MVGQLRVCAMGFKFLLTAGLVLLAQPAWADVFQASPTAQRWRRAVPDVARAMVNSPSFRTRLRLGYGEIADDSSWQVGIEDLRVGQTRVTMAAHVQGGAFSSGEMELRSYVRPLGAAWNVAAVVGYGRWRGDREGLALGGRLLLPLSRGGGSDIAVGQSWLVNGGSVTTVGVGYAISPQVRLATEFQRLGWVGETRGTVLLEWMP